MRCLPLPLPAGKHCVMCDRWCDCICSRGTFLYHTIIDMYSKVTKPLVTIMYNLHKNLTYSTNKWLVASNQQIGCIIMALYEINSKIITHLKLQLHYTMPTCHQLTQSLHTPTWVINLVVIMITITMM